MLSVIAVDWLCVFSIHFEFQRLAGKVMSANPLVKMYTRPLFSFDNGLKKIPEWIKLYWKKLLFSPFYDNIFMIFFFHLIA